MNSEKPGRDELAIIDELRRVSEISTGIDISAGVMKRIREMEEHARPVKLNPFRWRFAMTLAGLFLIILISFTFLFFEKEYSSGKNSGNREIKINSVEIEGREAKQYHFNSENRNRVVIWVQKYAEG